MRQTILAAAAVLTLATTTAHADQARDFDPIPEPQQQVVESHDKSPELAVGMSIGITIGGYVMMAKSSNGGMSALGFGAAFLGPSVGQWYAGKTGGIGIGARAIGMTMMVYGLVQLLSSSQDCFDCGSSPSTVSDDRRAKVYLGTGAALWVGSTIFDFVMAYRETETYNRRQHAQLVPTLIPTYNGTQAPGMAFSTRF